MKLRSLNRLTLTWEVYPGGFNVIIMVLIRGKGGRRRESREGDVTE